MPVDSLHPDYAAMRPRMQALRDAFDGETAVKARGTTYLPQPGGMTSNEYDKYKMRAKWFNASRRTVAGLAGAVFRKDPNWVVPEEMESHFSDITLTGVSLESFLIKHFQDTLLMGRSGILVDHTRNLQVGRPLWVMYRAEEIINWRIDVIDGQEVPSMVVICDKVPAIGNDMFDVDFVTQYRVHFLNPDGIYQVDIYEDTRTDRRQRERLEIIDSFIPVRRREPLRFIPFQFFGSEMLTSDIQKSMVEDLVHLNFVNYRHHADYEHGLNLTSLPTAVVTGHTQEEDELLIGSMAAWVLSNPDARVYFLEYQGQGLGSHERAIEADKREMATLGARLLEAQPQSQETFGAVQLRHSGEHGTLQALAAITARGISRVMRWHAWWSGLTNDLGNQDIVFEYATDFITEPLNAQDMLALMQVWQGGGMSQETFLWNLKQGERLPPGVEVEDERSRILTEAPATIPFPFPEDEAVASNGSL